MAVKKLDYSNDPVEDHILKVLKKLQHQNKRLKDHIEKTGAWAQLKKLREWKPFDFYHYFCTKYQEKYRAEYLVSGNIVRSYQRIEAFMLGNKITNEEYKKFIDSAFERYFTNVNMPRIGSICSSSLFKHLMEATAKRMTPKDYQTLDQQIEKEYAEFDKLVRDYEAKSRKTRRNKK